MASEFFHQSTLFRTEGAGKTGRRLAPMVRVQKKSTRQNHRFSQDNRPSLRNGFTTDNALAPVTGLSCHRRFADHIRKA